MDNKDIFARNLKRLMDMKEISRKEIADVLGISYFTVSDWVNGKKYPRMDKVELLANYFGVLKSDLIEEESLDRNQLPPIQEPTEGERMVMELFRRVPESQKKMVIQMLQVALGQEE